MISYEQAMSDQRDLQQLCQPKKSASAELYGANNNYGFASILKHYSGYPLNQPIRAIIPHGVYLSEKNIYSAELNVNLPAVLNYPPFRLPAWKKKAKRKKIIPSASPFLYALKLFKAEFPETERKGSLYFPSHSTAMVKTAFDQDLLIKQLKQLPDEYQPVTICIHWFDLTQGMGDFFQSHGFPIISAGHLHDDEFIFRWLHLVSQFKYTMSSNLGSSLFYSIAAGVPHRLLHASVSHHRKNDPGDKKPEGKSSQDRMTKLWRTFARPIESPQVSDEQAELVNYCLGKASLKQPRALLELLQKLQ